MSKKLLLVSASALLLAAAVAAPASARNSVNMSTGGSSLIAPYIAQIWGARAGSTPTTPYPGTSAISNPANASDKVQFWTSSSQKKVGSSPVTDGSNTLDSFNYLSSNSTGGIKGFFSGSKSNLGTAPAGFTNLQSSIFFSLSDAALTKSGCTDEGNAGNGYVGSCTADIDVYYHGGVNNGLTYVAPGKTPAAGQYYTPVTLFGNLIQIPFSIDPVAFAYNPTNLTINTADSKLHLDKAAYCGIFNGQITNWNDSRLTALNGGTQLNANLPITLVGRTDGSGTTTIFTRHLENVCSNSAYYTGTNNYVMGAGLTNYANLPSAVTFTKGAGSGDVANAVNNTAGAIGYIGADYVDPAVNNTQVVSFALPAASLQIGTTSTYAQPTAADAVAAFGSVAPPSNATDAADQTKWAPFVTDPSAGYPVIGTTNILLGTVYCGSACDSFNFNYYDALTSTGSGGSNPVGFLRWYYDSSNTTVSTILGNAALGAMPSSWNSAIIDTFVTNASGYNLQIHN